MLFNSYIFWFFFAIVLLFYFRLSCRRQNWLLLIGSYIFYGAWDWRFLLLVFFSTAVDYTIGISLYRTSKPSLRKALITLSVMTQLTLLGFFKYYNFFSREFLLFLNNFGIHLSLPLLHVILPVGISFYTFQSMSYTIDVYRGNSKPVTDPLNFGLYVCFFPQLVAGPIERSCHLVPQYENPRPNRLEDKVEGVFHIMVGLFKKVVIADNLAPIVNTVFQAPAHTLTGGECWMGVYAFAFQIYGDFSGYSSIAKGVALIMGFNLMDNFNMPYFAISPSDFWQRWHISLSRWLRDYLYIPLGGNRCSNWKIYRNLTITMLLGGLWHGANWTFIAWGAFHGLLLCGYRLFERNPSGPPPKISVVARILKTVLMFHFTCIGWLLFRATTLGQAWEMLGRMLTNLQMTSFAWGIAGMIAFFVGPLFLYELWIFLSRRPLRLIESHWFVRGMAYSYILLMMISFAPMVPSEFIYFQF
jgi:D-alanyl-lipoteichoic acid acyltransferase DltB (MBOAT superfamily)